MKRKTFKFCLTLFTFSWVLLTPVLAQNPPDLPEVWPIVYNGIKFFFSFISIVAAAMVLYGAYMWMFSSGDPQKVKMAQGVLTWAVIGLIFFMVVRFSLDFILRILGIEVPVPTQDVF